MNVVDIVILGILALSVVYGLHRGFVRTVLSVAAVIVAVILAFTFSPRLADYVRQSPGVTSTLTTYTDAVARVGDYDLAQQNVDNLSPTLVDTILDSVALPEQIASILRTNLNGHVFSGTGVTTVNDYVQNTLVAVAINVLSFIVCFFVAYLLLGLLCSLIHHVFRFPILKQLDWLAGGLFGLLRGGLMVYVIFLLLPILSTVIPLDSFNQVVQSSQLAGMFGSEGFFASVIAGKLF